MLSMSRSILSNSGFPALSRDFAFVLGLGLEGIWKEGVRGTDI